MSFDPPPPPPPPPSGGEPDHPGGVPGYPGTGGTPQHPGPPQYPGAPQYPGGSGPMGGPPPYSGAYPQNHPNGTVILVLGILGLIVCAPVGVAAWVMGNNALKEIDSSGVVYANRGSVQAGKILGIIATVLMILSILAFVMFMVTGGFLALNT